jgi:hypothetical protein
MSELAQLSCGHSCVVAKPEGMATNGGCRCLRDLPDEQRRRVHRALMLYRQELAALREVEKCARAMFPYLGTDDDAIRPGKRRPLFDALARLDALREGK